MRRLPLFPGIAIVFWISLASATQPHYFKGKLVSIEQKTRSRVLYYQVNTPVTKEDPYYEIGVDVNGTTYIGIYTPRHEDDTPPDSWKAGETVDTRLEKHYIYLKPPGGPDMKLELVKRFATQPAAATH